MADDFLLAQRAFHGHYPFLLVLNTCDCGKKIFAGALRINGRLNVFSCRNALILLELWLAGPVMPMPGLKGRQFPLQSSGRPAGHVDLGCILFDQNCG
ncbi:MAG: hypothetical protein C4519_06775 [Desulfobacteraceae bacterium]|nr:MAG: hypothetical protein C4519_06775 [Desulfobacteraceae bacterium]